MKLFSENQYHIFCLWRDNKCWCWTQLLVCPELCGRSWSPNGANTGQQCMGSATQLSQRWACARKAPVGPCCRRNTKPRNLTPTQREIWVLLWDGKIVTITFISRIQHPKWAAKEVSSQQGWPARREGQEVLGLKSGKRLTFCFTKTYLVRRGLKHKIGKWCRSPMGSHWFIVFRQDEMWQGRNDRHWRNASSHRCFWFVRT